MKRFDVIFSLPVFPEGEVTSQFAQLVDGLMTYNQGNTHHRGYFYQLPVGHIE